MSKSSDIAFVKSLGQNSAEVYPKMYSPYFGRVKHLVCSNSGTLQEAEDLFQDCIVWVCEVVQGPSFKLKSKLSTLILRITRNQWLKSLRDGNINVPLTNNKPYLVLNDYSAPKRTAALNPLNAKMTQAIARLGEPCRYLLSSFYRLKQSMQEIAINQGFCSASHAKTQKCKCLQRLRKMAPTWK